MRNYSIKRGHTVNVPQLLKKYFEIEAANSDIEKGCEIIAQGIGTIFIQKKGQKISIETRESSSDTSIDIIKKWNNFLYDLTGRNAKERKKNLTSSQK
jgi:hypothetical protein